MYNVRTGEAWEVKPVSVGITAARKQLDRYVNGKLIDARVNTQKLRREDFLLHRVFLYTDISGDMYSVRYEYAGAGAIIYAYEKLPRLQEIVTVPERERQKVEETPQVDSIAGTLPALTFIAGLVYLFYTGDASMLQRSVAY